jgi:hypothetical protein
MRMPKSNPSNPNRFWSAGEIITKFARDIVWSKGNPISSTTLQDIQIIVDLQFQLFKIFQNISLILHHFAKFGSNRNSAPVMQNNAKF